MLLRVLCVGRRARDPLLEAADDYLTRLGRYTKAELVRVRESNQAGEREELLGRLRPDDLLIALDERGTALTTEEIAGALRRWSREAVRTATFVIGGATGLHPDVLARAREKWSLSRLTLPHRLALVLLLEQLYRAHTILRGEPYHRA